jgi:hypothetical protein
MFVVTSFVIVPPTSESFTTTVRVCSTAPVFGSMIISLAVDCGRVTLVDPLDGCFEAHAETATSATAATHSRHLFKRFLL